MKRSQLMNSFFFQSFLILGGIILVLSIFKVWYLQHIIEEKCGVNCLMGISEYGKFFLLDGAWLLVFGMIIWKQYQKKLAIPLTQLAGVISHFQMHESIFSPDVPPCAEIRELFQAADTMLKHVNSLMNQVNEAGQKILEASKFAFSASKNQSALFSAQVTGSHDMAKAIREFVTTAQHMSDDVDSVADVANRTLEFAKQGQQAVMDVVQSMEDIRCSSQRSSDKIIALGKQSEHINDVVKTIDRIIEDTKLIAFNATIEAARAKDEGKGFGVVALEIRRLAEEVFESTEDIKELIQEIQGASHALVLATEEEMKSVHRGAQLAEEAGDSLKQIFDMVKLTTESAQRIASATQQQKGASEYVLQSVETAHQATRQFSQESKQLAVTAAELNILADGLRQIIAGFGVQ